MIERPCGISDMLPDSRRNVQATLLAGVYNQPTFSSLIATSIYTRPAFIREMSNAPTHGGPEGLPSAQEKKPLPSLISSSFLSLVRRHPFLLSIAISMIITGILAGVANRSYTQDRQDLYSQIPPNEDGASGLTVPTCVLTNRVS